MSTTKKSNSPKGIDAAECARLRADGLSNADIAAIMGCSPSSVQKAVNRAKVGNEDETQPSKRLAQELRFLKAQVKTLQEHALSDEKVAREIFKLVGSPVDPPSWLTKSSKRISDIAGVPTFFASDWHWGEVVRPAEIGGVNEYNLKIAHERARTFIQVGIELLRKHLANQSYPGVVFVLGGDMLSGDIHDELKETNEVESFPALLDLFGVLIWCIETLANEFGQVFVPAVTGNHGRTSKKPRAKRRNHTNMDWLLYKLLQKHFAGDARVQFLIPEGPDAYYRVFGTRYLLTHGDQFRGGDGMIGALGPISRGDKKKRARNAQVDRGYDVMLLGHWHQYLHLNRYIVNGTLKGYDEYADSNNFDVEPAQQALWITHPEHGITFRMPVYVQRRGVVEKAEWVSIQKAAA